MRLRAADGQAVREEAAALKRANATLRDAALLTKYHIVLGDLEVQRMQRLAEFTLLRVRAAGSAVRSPRACLAASAPLRSGRRPTTLAKVTRPRPSPRRAVPSGRASRGRPAAEPAR